MPLIEIEPGDLKQKPCPDCGAKSGVISGFTYQDGSANSVYFLGWCEGDHDQRTAFLTVSSGEWGEGTSGADRICVGIEVREAGMRLAEEPVIARDDFLGRFVPRDEALELGGLDGLDSGI